MYKPFRLSSFVFVPVPLPVLALVFVLLLLLLFLLTHDVCVGWGVLFVVVLLFLCVVCCAGSVSVCFLFVPSSLMRPCDLVILLFCCALSVCNVCSPSLLFFPLVCYLQCRAFSFLRWCVGSFLFPSVLTCPSCVLLRLVVDVRWCFSHVCVSLLIHMCVCVFVHVSLCLQC